jgi:hypothetical protein
MKNKLKYPGLASFIRKDADAWSPSVLIEAGIPGEVVRTWIADGPRAVPMRARLSLEGRKRTELTTNYIWSADLRFLGGL